MSPGILSLNKLSLSDRELFDRYSAKGPKTLSAYGFAPVYVWKDGKIVAEKP